jgi:hypothetical protein
MGSSMLRATLLALVLLPAAAAADGSMRCPGGLVSAGDSKIDLVGKCGWPALREDADGQVAVLREPGGALWDRRVAAGRERWTYDFGPSRFIQVVVLELGKVVAIERGGYGYEREREPRAAPIPRARCTDPAFREGDTAYEVLARCGEPAFREARVELRTLAVTTDGGGAVVAAQSVTVTVEVWTYDFGPSAFVRRLTLEDGKVVRVETGSYGYAR